MKNIIILIATSFLVACSDGKSSFDVAAYSEPAKKHVPVAAHGAYGSDLIDDTDEIQAAINATPAGGTVYFSSGTFLVDARGLTIPNGVSLLGNGAALKVGAHALPANFCLVLGIYCSDFTIEGLTFDFGDATLVSEYQAPVSLIGLLSCNRFSIRNCKFLGIGLGSGTGPLATGSIGVITTGGADFTVSDNLFSDTAARNTFTQAALFSNAGGSPIRWEFSRNRLIGCGLLGTGSRFVIANNNAVGVRYGGALAVGDADGEFGVISGNICLGAVGTDANGFPVDGIQNYVPRTMIYGNTCSDNAGSGIDNGAQGCVITGNLCVSNGVVAGHGIASNYAGSLPHENASYSTYSGNVCTDRLGSLGTQLYGYADASSLLSGIVVTDNRFTGNKIGESLLLGGP